MAVNNISLNGPAAKPVGVPYDIQTEQTRLARLRKVQEALAASSLGSSSPASMYGKVAIANWGDAIGRVADAIGAAKMDQNLSEREQKVAQDYNDRLSTGIQDFYHTMQPHQEEGVGPPAPDNSAAPGPPPSGMVPGNPLQAISNAVGSGIGPLQDLGMGMLKAQTAGAITPKDLLDHAQHLDPKAISAIANYYGWNLPPEFFTGRGQVQTAGGVALGTQDGTVVSKTPVERFTQGTANVGGVPVPVQTGDVTGKQEGSTGVSAPPALRGEDAFETGLAGDQVKRLSEGYDTLQKQATNLPTVIQTAALADKAMIGTPWSDLQLQGAKILNGLGFKPDLTSRIPATEQLNSFLGQRLLANAKPLGSGNGFSDRDLKFLSGVEGVGSVRDPRTVKALAALNVAGTLNMADNQDQLIQRAAATRGGDTAAKVQAMYQVPITLKQLPGSTLEQLKIYKDPATGKWTSGLVDDAIAGGAVSGASNPQGAPSGRVLRFDEQGNLVQ